MRRVIPQGTLAVSLLLPVFLFLAAVVAVAEGPAAQPAGLFAVDKSEVCVVADRAPGEPTIAVELDGRTYHVCCVRCEARLKEDPSFRFSADPVTGRPVDKADAFIAVVADGRAFYFESERTARIFDAILRAQSSGADVY